MQNCEKVGLLKIRLFRPFPQEEIAQALKHVKAIAVMDRSEGFSAAGGPLFAEVRSALYMTSERPAVVNYIYGLGGRDVRVSDIGRVYSDLFEIMKSEDTGDTYRYLGVRE
jgi:pyruvate ferredoxin oxidoreductase alpha subunit